MRGSTAVILAAVERHIAARMNRVWAHDGDQLWSLCPYHGIRREEVSRYGWLGGPAATNR